MFHYAAPPSAPDGISPPARCADTHVGIGSRWRRAAEQEALPEPSRPRNRVSLAPTWVLVRGGAAQQNKKRCQNRADRASGCADTHVSIVRGGAAQKNKKPCQHPADRAIGLR